VSQLERWKRYPSLRVWMLLSLILVIRANATSERTRAEYNAKRIKALIEELKKQMEIPQQIEAVFVPKNELIVSVQPVRERPGVFQISFEEDFLNTLDDGELRAVIAHELGHVWIFTHHPYLQTEDLANSIAFKVVAQDSLDRVYDKVRARNIVAGTLSAFMH
jgi:vancomycin resistance protein YoaR